MYAPQWIYASRVICMMCVCVCVNRELLGENGARRKDRTPHNEQENQQSAISDKMERAAISDNDDGEGKGRAKEQHDNLRTI